MHCFCYDFLVFKTIFHPFTIFFVQRVSKTQRFTRFVTLKHFGTCFFRETTRATTVGSKPRHWKFSEKKTFFLKKNAFPAQALEFFLGDTYIFVFVPTGLGAGLTYLYLSPDVANTYLLESLDLEILEILTYLLWANKLARRVY